MYSVYLHANTTQSSWCETNDGSWTGLSRSGSSTSQHHYPWRYTFIVVIQGVDIKLFQSLLSLIPSFLTLPSLLPVTHRAPLVRAWLGEKKTQEAAEFIYKTLFQQWARQEPGPPGAHRWVKNEDQRGRKVKHWASSHHALTYLLVFSAYLLKAPEGGGGGMKKGWGWEGALIRWI